MMKLFTRIDKINIWSNFQLKFHIMINVSIPTFVVAALSEEYYSFWSFNYNYNVDIEKHIQ